MYSHNQSNLQVLSNHLQDSSSGMKENKQRLAARKII